MARHVPRRPLGLIVIGALIAVLLLLDLVNRRSAGDADRSGEPAPTASTSVVPTPAP